jgi:hypothetical protein
MGPIAQAAPWLSNYEIWFKLLELAILIFTSITAWIISRTSAQLKLMVEEMKREILREIKQDYVSHEELKLVNEKLRTNTELLNWVRARCERHMLMLAKHGLDLVEGGEDET